MNLKIAKANGKAIKQSIYKKETIKWIDFNEKKKNDYIYENMYTSAKSY